MSPSSLSVASSRGSPPARCHILKPPWKNTEILPLCHNCPPACPRHYLYQSSTTAAIGTVTVGHFKPQLPRSQLIIQCGIHTHMHATDTHSHADSEPSPSSLAAFPVHFPLRSSRPWRAYLPHRASCQQAAQAQHSHRGWACARPQLQIIMHIIIWGVRRMWKHISRGVCDRCKESKLRDKLKRKMIIVIVV